MKKPRTSRTVQFICALVLVALVLQSGAWSAAAQTAQQPIQQAAGQTGAPPAGQAARTNDDPVFTNIYRDFYNTYRLGPNDEIAVRVTGQPEYTLEKVKVSPTGMIYHPLVGDIEVGGMTIEQLKNKLTKDFGEYVVNPKVSVSLNEAVSAKVGVLGDVQRPGVVIMNQPMTVIEAISATGGFTQFGNEQNVSLIRLGRDGRMMELKVNVKKILQGKADAEENLPLQAGDTIFVHGNKKKVLSYISTLAGFSSFVAFITLGRI